MTTPKEREELEQIALRVAEEAAAVVATGYRTRPHAEHKARADLVTEFDRRSEELLVTRLSAETPGVRVVCEEGAPASPSNRAGLVWYVDPLDGTTNFVHGHPFWCVSVGLMEDDWPIVGAVVAPSLGLRWSARLPPELARAAGSSREGGGAKGTAVADTDEAAKEAAEDARALRNGEPCRVSSVASIRDALVATGFPPVRDRAPENNFESFRAMKIAAQAVRRCGSAALDLCLVGDGTYDAYWERRLHAWDVVAGSAVVLAAGGTVSALDGGRPNWHVGHLVATNGLLHDEVLRALARADRAASRAS